MALAAELRRRLSSTELGPPEKRLRLAVQIFESPHLRVARKEEAVIEALCRQESWEALRECLKSERYVRASLRPTVRKKLVQVAAKDAECGRLLLQDLQTSNYLAARPQEFNSLCKALFANPDVATLKAAVSCARRCPTPLSLAPFLSALSAIELDAEAVQQLALVIDSGKEILDHLKDKVTPKTVGLAARVIAAKYGKSDPRTEEFIVALVDHTKNDEEAIGEALATIDSVENREWLSSVFESILSKKNPKNLVAAFRPLAHLDLLLFESLIPKFMANLSGYGDLDGLLTESLSAAEKEQRPHKLVAKFLEGVSAERAPKLVQFPEALGTSALSWPSKNLAAAISGLIFHLENHEEGAFFATAVPLLSSLLEASKAAQHNTPDLVREKFESLLQQVSGLLEKFAVKASKSVKKSDGTGFLSAYLRLCVTYGELKLLLLHYNDDQETPSSVGATLLDFSLLFPFVSDWPTLANAAFTKDDCRNSIVHLVDQKIRAATLLELELEEEQQEAAALMLASCSVGQLSSSLDLLREKLSKSTLIQVADSLAAGLLQKPTRTFSGYFDNDVALALLRAMKEQDMALGVLGQLKLKAPEKPCDAMSAPDAELKGAIQPFILAFGQIHPTDLSLRLLCGAALFAACFGMESGWNEAIPVFVGLLCDLIGNFNMEKLLTWTNQASVNADKSLLEKFASGLFHGRTPTTQNLECFTAPLKPLAVATLKHFMGLKLSPDAQKLVEKIAQTNGIKAQGNKSFRDKNFSDIRSASPQQLTELFKSKTIIDAFAADAAFTRMLQFDLGDINTLKSTAVCLNAFITSRSALTVDRLPVIQQRLQSICSAVIEAQADEASADIAHLVEGMGVAMAKYKKDFARVAPFYAADVLGLFESKAMQQNVKVHLERYLQSLLRLCDEHGEVFLLRASTPACQQILHAQLSEKKKVEKYV